MPKKPTFLKYGSHLVRSTFPHSIEFECSKHTCLRKMATEQQQVIPKDQHKATTEEMVKEATNVLTKNIKEGIVIPQQQAIVAGAIKNDAERGIPISLNTVHSWSGKFVINPPKEIQKLLPGVFLHDGATVAIDPRGSKAAVVYSQLLDDPHIGFLHTWVLAWSVPTTPGVFPINKVYVTAGPGIPRKHGEIEWDEIERRLNVSRDSSTYFDPITKAAAHAKITGEGNQASLGAVFAGNII